MPKYTWDERKRRSNIQKHGLDMRHAPDVFEDPHSLNVSSDRNGETRWKLVGSVFGALLTVVYSIPKRLVIRIISFRRANKREARTYFEQPGVGGTSKTEKSPNHE